MVIIKEGSLSYNDVVHVKNQLIKQAPLAFPNINIFKNDKMQFIFWGWGAVLGDLNGVFHESISNILKKMQQPYYYIIPLNINMEMYDTNLPVIKVFTFDKNETYSSVFGLDFCFESGFTGYTLASIPDCFLYCNEIKNWLLFYNRYSDLGIYGYTDEIGKQLFLEKFENYVLSKERLLNEIDFIYPIETIELFKKEYLEKITDY